ncbi:trypsin-like serine protease [Corynebacterium sp. LK2510]|uniref:trypsin-like serine protease n=1 Tax=Corynebacterium sp. LK2510 TaxID=3110472 RepID=UPI0034CD01B1
MRVGKKCGGSLLTVATFASVVTGLPHAVADDRPSLQATSTTPVEDNRIAALWHVVTPASADAAPQVRRECTVSYVGDGFWLTAHHCVSQSPSMDGYLEQFDGQRAGIAGIYTLSDTDDVALIEAGSGIDADTFDVAQDPLEIGQQATMTGYGETHEYASSATTTIINHRNKIDFGSAVYTDLFEAQSVTASRSCGGDSGAPVYIGSTIYAIHTGGGYNPSCLDGKGMLMWHTNIASRAEWISNSIRMNAGLTKSQRQKAAAGLSAAPRSELELSNVEQGNSSPFQGPLGSSHSSS